MMLVPVVLSLYYSDWYFLTAAPPIASMIGIGFFYLLPNDKANS